MKRRAKARGKRVKAQRSAASKLKRRAAQSETAALTASPVVGAQREVPNLVRELNDAREQLAATSEVLHAISSSRGDLQPIFQSMLSSAARLCEAKFGSMWLAEGDGFRPVALYNVSPALAASRQPDQLIHFPPETPVGRVAMTKRLVHVADIRSDPGYAKGFAQLRELSDVGGARTLLMVPMLKGNELVGAYAIYRLEVRPFTDQQIGLVKNFAAQAVIAIENARLLNELRQRTDDLTERTADLTEALEQQTATSEVLQVISSSPGDLQPVFATMLERAARICGAKFGNIFRWDGDTMLIHLPPSPKHAGVHRFVPFISVRKAL
jgi:transcriptional regulator with GAF, ATPase, and Fis domain